MFELNKKEFTRRVKQKLLIHSKELEQLLNTAIFELQNSSYKTEAKKQIPLFFQIESIFDSLLTQKLSIKNTVKAGVFLKNVKERLDKKFYIKEIPKKVFEIYENCRTSFLNGVVNNKLEIIPPTITLRQKFHKKWDDQILTLVRLKNSKLRALAIDYWWHYFNTLPTKKMFKRYRSVKEEDVLTDAFIKFLTWVENPLVVIEKNSDAAFLQNLKWAISNSNKVINKQKNRFDNNFEEEYRALLKSMEKTTNEYIEVLPTAMTQLDFEDYAHLKQYYWEGYSMREMGEWVDTSKQNIDARIKKARKNLKSFLDKLMNN